MRSSVASVFHAFRSIQGALSLLTVPPALPTIADRRVVAKKASDSTPDVVNEFLGTRKYHISAYPSRVDKLVATRGCAPLYAGGVTGLAPLRNNLKAV